VLDPIRSVVMELVFHVISLCSTYKPQEQHTNTEQHLFFDERVALILNCTLQIMGTAPLMADYVANIGTSHLSMVEFNHMHDPLFQLRLLRCGTKSCCSNGARTHRFDRSLLYCLQCPRPDKPIASLGSSLVRSGMEKRSTLRRKLSKLVRTLFGFDVNWSLEDRPGAPAWLGLQTRRKLVRQQASNCLCHDALQRCRY
jgi:hypothetical protein